ncbi:tyrosine-type recombinase/integrase [Verrucomicrobiota bacterium sgz303538]
MPAERRTPIRKEWLKVRKVSLRGDTRFLVDGRPHKERLFFREKNDALVQADVWARERQNQGIEALEVPTALRVEAQAAAKLLRPFGKSLLDAAKYYVAFLEAEDRKIKAASVQACLDDWVGSKKAEAAQGVISERTIDELEGRAKLFATAFGSVRISEIDEEAVQTFLDSLPVTQRTRLNIRTKLAQFLNYCRRRKWIDSNPAEIVTIRVPSSEVSILSPSEADQLLRAAEKSASATVVVPYVAVGLFAGLRPGEIEHLKWEMIRFETGEIEVRGETSKRRETRFVHIEPTLHHWLVPHRKECGPITGANFRRQWEQVRISAGYSLRGSEGVPWPDDVLRHSYGSYWLAKHGDRSRLAELMGNTVQVIRKHYRRAIPKKEADAFWDLRPSEKSANILPN